MLRSNVSDTTAWCHCHVLFLVISGDRTDKNDRKKRGSVTMRDNSCVKKPQGRWYSENFSVRGRAGSGFQPKRWSKTNPWLRIISLSLARFYAILINFIPNSSNKHRVLTPGHQEWMSRTVYVELLWNIILLNMYLNATIFILLWPNLKLNTHNRCTYIDN